MAAGDLQQPVEWADCASWASRRLRTRQAKALLLLLVYLAIGVLFYVGVETKPKDCDAAPSSSGTSASRPCNSEVDELGDTSLGSGPALADDSDCEPEQPDDAGAAGAAGVTPPAHQLAAAQQCTEPWSGVDAMYFAVVTMSTVRFCDADDADA